MFAVIRTGGKQYKVEEGQLIKVESLDVPAGETVEIGDVLLVDTGEATQVGTPNVENAVVQATVVDHDKHDKVVVFKKKRRKQYKRFRGHRQPYTALKIEKINI